MISTSSVTEGLWLDTLHGICGRAAHELRGAMNGVAVNLEVVRSRSAKPEAPASAVRTFAEAATVQFEAVIEMTEALLALTRPPKSAIDVGMTARQVVSLLSPPVKAEGRELSIDGSLEGLGTTAAEASAARLAIGACLLAASDAPNVTCRDTGASLQIVGDNLRLPSDEILAAVKDAGIDIQAEPSAISISFPR